MWALRNQSDLSSSRATSVKISAPFESPRFLGLPDSLTDRIGHRAVVLSQSMVWSLMTWMSVDTTFRDVERATSWVVPSAVPPLHYSLGYRLHVLIDLGSELLPLFRDANELRPLKSSRLAYLVSRARSVPSAGPGIEQTNHSLLAVSGRSILVWVAHAVLSSRVPGPKLKQMILGGCGPSGSGRRRHSIRGRRLAKLLAKRCRAPQK